MPKIYWQFICPQLSRVVELARQILKAAGILLKTSRKMLSYFCLKRDQRKYFCGLSMDTRIARCCTNAVPMPRKGVAHKFFTRSIYINFLFILYLQRYTLMVFMKSIQKKLNQEIHQDRILSATFDCQNHS